MCLFLFHLNIPIITISWSKSCFPTTSTITKISTYNWDVSVETKHSLLKSVLWKWDFIHSFICNLKGWYSALFLELLDSHCRIIETLISTSEYIYFETIPYNRLQFQIICNSLWTEIWAMACAFWYSLLQHLKHQSIHCTHIQAILCHFMTPCFFWSETIFFSTLWNISCSELFHYCKRSRHNWQRQEMVCPKPLAVHKQLQAAVAWG